MSSIRFRAFDDFANEVEGLKPTWAAFFKNRQRPFTEDEISVGKGSLSVRWTLDAVQGSDSDTRQRELTVMVDIAAANSAALDALVVVAQKAGESDPTLGGLVSEIVEVEVRGDVAELAATFHMAVVEFVIRYSHTIEDPEI